MANEEFLDMPSLRTIVISAIIIGVFLGGAYGLYQHTAGSPSNIGLKSPTPLSTAL